MDFLLAVGQPGSKSACNQDKPCNYDSLMHKEGQQDPKHIAISSLWGITQLTTGEDKAFLALGTLWEIADDYGRFRLIWMIPLHCNVSQRLLDT